MKNKYSFNCLYLDRENRILLEDYCIKNKIVDKHIKPKNVDWDNLRLNYPSVYKYMKSSRRDDLAPYEIEFASKKQLHGISNLLSYLTLFENIDSNESVYDFHRLTEIGIINENAHIINEDDVFEHPTHNEKYDEVFEIALNIMKMKKRSIVSKFRREYPLHNTLCRDEDDHILSLSKDYDEIIRFSNYYDNRNPNSVFSYISSEMDNLMRGIYYSKYENLTIGTGCLSIPDRLETVKKIDDVYCTIKTQLPDEINIIPRPQNMEEVIKFRKSAELNSFRQIIQEWFKYIDEGDMLLAEKIKSDAIKANQALTKLERYQKCLHSPYFRVFNLVGGMIPGLSTILTIYGFISSFVEDGIQRDNEWVLMPTVIHR